MSKSIEAVARDAKEQRPDLSKSIDDLAQAASASGGSFIIQRSFEGLMQKVLASPYPEEEMRKLSESFTKIDTSISSPKTTSPIVIGSVILASLLVYGIYKAFWSNGDNNLVYALIGIILGVTPFFYKGQNTKLLSFTSACIFLIGLSGMYDGGQKLLNHFSIEVLIYTAGMTAYTIGFLRVLLRKTP